MTCQVSGTRLALAELSDLGAADELPLSGGGAQPPPLAWSLGFHTNFASEGGCSIPFVEQHLLQGQLLKAESTEQTA